MTESSWFPDVFLSDAYPIDPTSASRSMNLASDRRTIRVGEWCAQHDTGVLSGPGGEQRLEPKVMDLLWLLAAEAGRVVARERIMATLWPGMVVGDDSLARTVSKLRQALGDDAKAPRYIETISKRGYRLLVELAPVEPTDASVPAKPTAAPLPSPVSVSMPASSLEPASPTRAPESEASTVQRQRRRAAAAGVVLVLLAVAVFGALHGRGEKDSGRNVAASDDSRVLVELADDFYFQFSRADNEAAIDLYQRVLGLHPDDVAALSGLANALVQRCVRWPESPGPGPVEFHQLRDALANGHLSRAPALQQLQRANALAERAVALAPDSPVAHKALGFTLSAQGAFEAALAEYRRTVELDADAWGALVNIGDVLEIIGHPGEAMPYFERAYAAMGRSYDRSSARVRPWHARLGVGIAERHFARGDHSAAETWYRTVLAHYPLDPPATRGLAELLRAGGDSAEADRLCAELRQRTAGQGCASP
jgi:DNA-binding winged helix-turn-helix (wHTH) protein/tetratricopeptide (TPR) repeat protein